RVTHRFDDFHDLLGDEALAIRIVGIAGTTALVGFSLVEGYVQRLLDLLGDHIAAVGDLAGELADAIGNDVEAGKAGSHVENGDGLILGQPSRVLEQILNSKGVDIANQRLQLGAASQLSVVVDLVTLGRHQQKIHLDRKSTRLNSSHV